MKLIITIDTEEDNWGEYSPRGATLGNIERIPYLQSLFDSFGVKPTYLITYPVAINKNAITILKGIYEDDGCEIGTHLHPWNTPPFEEETNEYNSMLCNLSADLQYKKLKYLHETIRNNFAITPTCFRTGRWGYSDDVGRNLNKLGYKVDTSMTPYTNWTSSYGPDFSDVGPGPFRIPGDLISAKSSRGHIMELPATVGFLQENFQFCNFVLKNIKRRPFKYMRLVGVLSKLHVVNKVWLSPEVSDGETMIKLAKRMIKNNCPFLNMVFHSSTLKAGLTPFVQTEDDEKLFFQHIKEFLIFIRDAKIESIKLSDIVK